ncbi:MAG: tRNA (guanosine(37)-N1)-methyltransferase TrmD [Pseudomonadota bacterium]|nr:tRNA (guanosine(37)-N1)-methyltransferase TrmD [Pseudomonadota bacterium]|tara:strand:- start:4270 stop:5010 length:741 start_codon:yes stop_codon:yes gene_type:complete
MKFSVVTIFPQIIWANLEFGILGKAIDKEKIEVSTYDPRDYSKSPTKRVDDKPFGGGSGMVMEAGPIIKAVEEAKKKSIDAHVIYLSPQGKLFNQEKAKELADKSNIILISGRYEGVDQRVVDHIVDEEISIGDYVLSGGEIASLILIDSISRQIEGVVGDFQSVEDDSLYDGLLKHPQYTRPEESEYGVVPKILLSGNHESIRSWKIKKSLENTMKKRPDLLEKANLDKEKKKVLGQIKKDEEKT